MSMLAERKVKQKWTLNPRGKHWTDDQNKFGQKMLEKMGWSNGKGLGANLDGVTEHIKVKYKNDSKGMGFKERDDQWTEHEDKFSTLLNTLSSTQDDTGKPKPDKKVVSLVEKSKNSKARIHYKKFTKGKDISQYSEKDLANVFGRKHLHKKKNEAAEESTTPETEDSDHTHGVKTVKGGSMADYFRKKLGNRSIESNGVSRKDSDSEDERPSFGFGFQGVNTEEKAGFGLHSFNTEERAGFGFQNGDTEERAGFGFQNVVTEKRAGFGFQSVNTEERAGFGFSGSQCVTPQKDATMDNNESVSSSKKKKKKSKVEGEDENRESVESLKKKKKRKSLECVGGNDLQKHESEECNDKNLTNGEVESKKKKHKKLEENEIAIDDEIITPKKACKKKRNVEDSPTFVSYINEELDNTGGKKRKLEEAEEKSPRKKMKKNKDVGLCNPGFDPIFHTPPMEKHQLNTITEADEEIDENEIQEEVLNDSSGKKKKKNKVLVNVEIGNNAEEVVESGGKKKKKRKFTEVDSGVENACFNGLDDGQVEEAVAENPYELKTKKKKKKKKKGNNKEDSLDEVANPKKPKLDKPSGIDNPALNVSIDEITFDMILNTTVETPKPKKPQQRRKSVTFSEVNQEHIIPNREELAAQQSELFDINTKILEESSKRRQKNNPNGYFDNRGFNMRSTGSEVYNKNLESSAPKNLGQANPGFVNTQENKIRNELDSYQSQVENDLNEAKAMVVGKPGKGLDKPQVIDEGVILPFKSASFFGINYTYFPVNMSAKGSYKHLIRGDITLCFKNANLHTVDGYGTIKKNGRNK